MKKYLEILKKVSLFAGVDDESLIIMLGCLGATVETYDKKYTVFAEGKPAKFIGVLLSGSAHIEQTDFYGNRSIVAKIEVGEMFGEAFACAEIKSTPVSIIADEESEIMLLNCSHILHTCKNACGFHQQLIFNLMKSLADKNIMFHQKIEITSKRSTREKLLAYLAFQEKKAGAPSFDIPFDRQELADYLEVDRSGLSSEISKLKKEGVLDSNKNHFELL